MKRGFTLVELLAVIVILAIILAIAVPGISSLINNATSNAFISDSKMIFKAIDYKEIEDDSFDPTTINEANIESLLKISATNYKKVTVTLKNNEPYIIIIGQNKWANLAVSGTRDNIEFHDSLVLWYSFMSKTNSDVDKATATDLSGLSHNGTLTNFAFTATSGYNTGLVFDGTNDYISIGNIGLSSMKSATISFWRKTSSTTQWLLLQGFDNGYYIMATSGTGAFYHNSIGSNSVIYVDGAASNTPKTDGQWHHYLITNVNLSSWTTLILNNYATYQYHSYLGDLKIYNRIFSATEVLNNYNAEKSDFGL